MPSPADDPSFTESVAGPLEEPDTSVPTSDDPLSAPSPRMLTSDEPTEYWDVELDEVIHLGLTNSRVLQDLGGTVLRNPDAVQTNLTPAVTQTDPRFGIEGALSEFDTRFNASGNFEHNDRIYNNQFASGGLVGRPFNQELNVYRSELTKVAATGSRFAVRNVTQYDQNNAPANQFGSYWDTYFEGEARHPLLQGGGVQYNRIAGPNGTPGFYNGVLIARMNADMSQADFEIALREYLSNLENAYWDLYFAYRDLDSKVQARDAALRIWQRIKASEGKLPGAERLREAQAREQYYRFEMEVQNALTGRRLEGTRSYNGSPGGTLRGAGGVYLAERRLRLLTGVEATDNRLMRPKTEPTTIEFVHTWDAAKSEALARRPELDRQRFRVKKQEMELTASRNFLKPTLDAVGRYRFRGFGQQLASTNYDNPSAFSSLSSGDLQEWQLGAEFSMPLGFRRGASAVKNAEYKLARERAMLREQERQVVHDLSNAIADLDRAYHVAQTAYDRREAGWVHLQEAREKAREESRGSLDTLFEAERRFMEADSQYHLAIVEYQLAVKNVNMEKGSLLEYHNIMATDGTTTIHVDGGTSVKGLQSPASSVYDTPALDPNSLPVVPQGEAAPATEPPAQPTPAEGESAEAELPDGVSPGTERISYEGDEAEEADEAEEGDFEGEQMAPEEGELQPVEYEEEVPADEPEEMPRRVPGGRGSSTGRR